MNQQKKGSQQCREFLLSSTMKNKVLYGVILIYVVFIACTLIAVFFSIYRKTLDKNFCECKGLSSEEIRLRANNEVEENDLRWIAAFFFRRKSNNSTAHFEYVFFCTGTGGSIGTQGGFEPSLPNEIEIHQRRPSDEPKRPIH